MRNSKTFESRGMGMSNERNGRLRCMFSFAVFNNVPLSSGLYNQQFVCKDRIEFVFITESKAARLLAEFLPWYVDSFTNPLNGNIHTIHSIEYLKRNTDRMRSEAIRVVQRKLRARNSLLLYWLKHYFKSKKYDVNPWEHEILRMAVHKPIGSNEIFDSTGTRFAAAV